MTVRGVPAEVASVWVGEFAQEFGAQGRRCQGTARVRETSKYSATIVPVAHLV